jgi:hypothetical protein
LIGTPSAGGAFPSITHPVCQLPCAASVEPGFPLDRAGASLPRDRPADGTDRSELDCVSGHRFVRLVVNRVCTSVPGFSLLPNPWQHGICQIVVGDDIDTLHNDATGGARA